jgi:hypothetical protein
MDVILRKLSVHYANITNGPGNAQSTLVVNFLRTIGIAM